METNRYVPLNEDVFLRILLEISDIDDLINACQQNDITFSLCKRLYFWRLWFNKYYPNVNQQSLNIQGYIRTARNLKMKEQHDNLFRNNDDINRLIFNEMDVDSRQHLILTNNRFRKYL